MNAYEWRKENGALQYCSVDEIDELMESYANHKNQELKELLLKVDYMDFQQWKKERDKLLKTNK